MLYNTRHMVAKRQLTHGDQLIEIGSEFRCTPVDAEFYVVKGWADDSTSPSGPPPPEQSTTEDAPKRRGRPPRVMTDLQDAPDSGQNE